MNKDEPKTWVRYRSNLCGDCYATCCTMPVEVRAEDLVLLDLCNADDVTENPKKVFKQLQKEGLVSSYREKTELFMLERKSNGDCIFLDTNRKCTVYEKRPGVCRKFPTEMSRRLGFCPYIRNDKST